MRLLIQRNTCFVHMSSIFPTKINRSLYSDLLIFSKIERNEFIGCDLFSTSITGSNFPFKRDRTYPIVQFCCCAFRNNFENRKLSVNFCIVIKKGNAFGMLIYSYIWIGIRFYGPWDPISIEF